METTISWETFSKAYLKCITKFADFATDIASDSHRELGLSYVDPHTMRSKRQNEEHSQRQERLRNRDSFLNFVEEIRKSQPFLRKATEDELEGIFARLSPAERKKYAEPVKSVGVPVKKRVASDSSKLRDGKKKVKDSFGDFINDEESDQEKKFLSGESDDVSLVSESELEEPSPTENKERTQTKVPTASSSGVKKFTWT